MWLKVSEPFSFSTTKPHQPVRWWGFALPTSGIEAFTLEGDSGRVPLTHHRYMTIKAGWLTRFLVDAAFNS